MEGDVVLWGDDTLEGDGVALEGDDALDGDGVALEGDDTLEGGDVVCFGRLGGRFTGLRASNSARLSKKLLTTSESSCLVR